MRPQKLAPFCALILGSLFVLFMGTTAHAQVSALAQICGYMGGKTQGLSQVTLATFKSTINAKNKLTQENCLTARPLFKVAGVSAYYQDKEGRYIFALQNAQDISSVVFSNTGVPEIQFNQAEVTMADGAKLPTFILREKNAPKGGKTGLTILTRSPYMNYNLGWVAQSISLVLQGYQVVQQPARGTFSSPGELEWLSWRQERSDAKATLDWISAQSWSSQHIVATGTSYDGFLALAAATTFHPNLVAVVAASAPWNAKEDSISGRADVLDVAAYVTTLNLFGHDFSPAHKAMGAIAEKTKTIPEFVRGIRSLFNLKFKWIPLDGNFPDNKEFAAEIKKSKATMLYSYGLHGDQDSRDILNLAQITQGTPHHYFLGQPLGHDNKVAMMLIKKIAEGGGRTAEEFSEGFKKEFGSKSSCAFLDAQGSQKFCENSVATIFPTKPMRLPLLDLNLLEGQSGVKWNLETSGMVLGQAKLRFKVTVPPLPSRMRLMYAPFYCVQDKCANMSEGTPGGEALTEGTQVIEFDTNHMNIEYQPGSTIGIVFKTIDAKSKVVNVPVEIKHIQFILPVIE